MDTKHLTGLFRCNHDGLFTVICLVSFTLFFTVIPCVYAGDGEGVNVMEFPNRLSEMMGIPFFAAQILATALILGLLTFVPALAQSLIGTVVMTIISLTLTTALTWTPYWLLIMVSVIIGLMFASNVKKLIAGGSD